MSHIWADVLHPAWEVGIPALVPSKQVTVSRPEGWLVSVVFSGWLRPPAAGRYIRNAHTEIGNPVSNTSGAGVDMPIDSYPEPSVSRKKGTKCEAAVTVTDQGNHVVKPAVTKRDYTKKRRNDIPTIPVTAARAS